MAVFRPGVRSEATSSARYSAKSAGLAVGKASFWYMPQKAGNWITAVPSTLTRPRWKAVCGRFSTKASSRAIPATRSGASPATLTTLAPV